MRGEMTVDALVDELGTRYGLGDKAPKFVLELIHQMRAAEGGIGGFFARLRVMGFEELTAKWLRGEETGALSSAFAIQILGVDPVKRIAHNAQIPLEAASVAVGAALPKITQMMAVNGELPDAATLDREAKSFAAVVAAGGAKVVEALKSAAAPVAPLPDQPLVSTGEKIETKFPVGYALVTLVLLGWLLFGSAFLPTESGHKEAGVDKAASKMHEDSKDPSYNPEIDHTADRIKDAPVASPTLDGVENTADAPTASESEPSEGVAPANTVPTDAPDASREPSTEPAPATAP